MADLSQFKDLQDRVIQYGYSEQHRNQIKAWINDAYRDVCRLRRWSWLTFTDNVTLTVGTRTVALPVTAGRELMTVLEVKPNDNLGARALEYEDLEADDPLGLGRLNFAANTARGTPSRYTIDGSNLVFDPTPDKAYVYSVRHYDVPVTELVGDTNTFLLPTSGANVLVYGALLRAATHDGNPNKHGMWAGLYAEALSGLEAREHRRNVQRTRRARMSPVHGRRFGG